MIGQLRPRHSYIKTSTSKLVPCRLYLELKVYSFNLLHLPVGLRDICQSRKMVTQIADDETQPLLDPVSSFDTSQTAAKDDTNLHKNHLGLTKSLLALIGKRWALLNAEKENLTLHFG